MSKLYYSRDEEGQFETHETEAAARHDAEVILGNCQEEACDRGWPEGTCDIEWGRLVPLGECVANNERESSNLDFDYMADYNLKDLPDPIAALQIDLEAAQRRVAELANAAKLLCSVIHENAAEVQWPQVGMVEAVAHDAIADELMALESLLTEKRDDAK